MSSHQLERINGLGVALVTPFKADQSLDRDTLKRLVNYQMNNGVDFFVVLGTTGESPTVESDERAEILQIVKSEVGSSFPIVLGMGDNSTSRLMRKVKEIDLDGIDALLSVVPFYNKPSQEGLFRHFSTLASSTDCPIILYNIPGRAGVDMLPETVAKLSKLPSIIGLKEANGGRKVSEIKPLVDNEFKIFSGDDSRTLEMMRQGGCGVISVVANALPKELSEVVHLAKKGDFEAAEEKMKKLDQIDHLLFKEGNPVGIKCLLSQMGLLPHNVLRLPLVCGSDALSQEMQSALCFL